MYASQSRNLAGSVADETPTLYAIDPKTGMLASYDALDAEFNYSTESGGLTKKAVCEQSEPLVSTFIQMEADCQFMSLADAQQHLQDMARKAGVNLDMIVNEAVKEPPEISGSSNGQQSK